VTLQQRLQHEADVLFVVDDQDAAHCKKFAFVPILTREAAFVALVVLKFLREHPAPPGRPPLE